MKNYRLPAILVFMLIGTSLPAAATAGAFPTIFLTVFFSWLLFFPLIIIRWLSGALILRNGWGNAFLTTLHTGALMTILFIPILSFMLGIVGLTFNISILCYFMLMPIEGDMGPVWGPNLAFALLCVIAFFVSVLLDNTITKRGIKEPDQIVKAGRFAWIGNALCYIPLIVLFLFTIPRS